MSGKSRQKHSAKNSNTQTTVAKATTKVQPQKKSNPLAPDRVAEILKRLDQLYPDVTCALTHTSAWELLVATILSAQSTDVNVNRVTPELFRKYPTVQAFAALTPEQLEPDVRSTGFFRNKSKSVVGAAETNRRRIWRRGSDEDGGSAYHSRGGPQDRECRAREAGSKSQTAWSSTRTSRASPGDWN